MLQALGVGVAAITALLAYNFLIENPALVAEAKRAAGDACTIRTMDAANRAETVERARQSEVNAQAVAGYRAALDREKRLRLEAQDERDKESAQHEQDLSAAGRLCLLTDADFDWLRAERDRPAEGGG